MQLRPYGSTGLTVSVLGLGASHIGADHVSDHEAETFLNQALDLGITLVDTARGYGRSEQRIGQFISHRRDEYILSTKCGYGIADVEDWTPGCIARGIDEALRLMRTDYIDIMHFHSCDQWRLERGGIIEPLLRAVEHGKVRVAAYSGENKPRHWAIHNGSFRGIQTSINICDQRVLEADLPAAAEKRIGVIAKRPIANAFWRFEERPVGDYAEDYWLRAREMQLTPGVMPWDEAALRFTAFTPGVSSCIVGTSKLSNLRKNAEMVEAGPLDETSYRYFRDAFRRCDNGWVGLV
ncbi:aldo/keto reductase [bacterium]|nr:aldo/keto reductase [bacterium]